MKGYIIDCDYVIRVKDYMERVELPRPTLRENVIVNDGEVLPIVLF